MTGAYAIASRRTRSYGPARLGCLAENSLRHRREQQLDVPNPDPLYRDEYAIYTMEHIVKTGECAGNLEQAAA